MITLLDYGAGNVRSVVNAIERLGSRVKIASGGEDIVNARKLVFPGVGAFGNMMEILSRKGYLEPLKAYLRTGRPFFGICLGMHALFEQSEEAPGVRGLGYFKGKVRRFALNLPVPHIGWNGVSVRKPSTAFAGMRGDEKFYFVHSYYVDQEDEGVVLTTTDYGISFVSAVQSGHVIATQFHPEKSGAAGAALLRNFIDSTEKAEFPPHVSGPTRLSKRIVACLDVRANDQGDLVVTKGDRYDVREKGSVRNLGKPVALAGRYYRQGADEIVFLNITGFRDFPLKDMPMIQVLKETSRSVFVPLTIGGGIRDYNDSDGRTYSALEVAAEYFRSGADKVSIGSDAVFMAEACRQSGGPNGKSAIEAIARVYGSQAVVVSIDPRRVYVKAPSDVSHTVIETEIPGPEGQRYCWYQCTIKGGREGRDIDAVTLARIVEKLGAGEILLNCIDRDGTRAGFDIELIRAVTEAVSIPVIASSGAGTEEHFYEVFTRTRAEAALAAGIFHRNETPIESVKAHLKGRLEIRT